MKIQIVNDSDEVIGAKERSEINYAKDIYRFTALWVVNSKGEVLIAQRKLTKDKDPGKWGPSVSGTIEEGEDYESNIYKEAEEEIGLSGVEFKKGPKFRMTQPRNAFAQWYIAHVDKDISEFTPQAEEVEKLEWKSYEELMEHVEQDPDSYISGMLSVLAILSRDIKL